jgi:glycosyltransferase involved in cell wall biosynthesis
LLSSLLKDDIKLVKKKHRIYYLANGIKQIPNEINKKETNDKSYKILYLSNLISSKGVLVLLEALHKVIGKGYDNFTVNFVGKTSKSITEEIFNKEIKRLKLQKKIKYLGAKYGEEKNEILDNSEIFVFPTLKDCFPLVLLEAMQSKLAIISTNEGAIPEIIENNVNGIICNKGDVEALCNAIIRLFEFPNLINEYGRNAQEKYKKHYTVKMFETNLIDCFNKIFAK